MLLFFVAGIILLASLFFWGVTKAAELLLPFLSIVSYVLIILFCVVVLPLSLVKKMRLDLSKYALIMSNVLGVTTWMMAFLFVVTYFGFWGIFFSFLFKFLAPIAFIGAVFKGSWNTMGNLMLWITFTYGMRFYSQWVLTLGPRMNTKGTIIDVEIVE